MPPVAVLVIMALVTAGVGALGGLGGAVLLVPALVLAGVEATVAAPLGLLSAAAGSLAAAAPQLADRSVNHRLGVVLEIAASGGAVAGALASGAVTEAMLTRALGVVAIAAAVAGGVRRGVRNPPRPGLTDDDVGERFGRLAGAYPVGGGVAPYEPRRVPAGLAAMAVSGVVAGVAGASGGFIKTPAATELMHVPVKVAAATTTFTVGITSASALLVFAVQGRIDPRPAAAVVLGSVIGGALGARLQGRLHPPVVRRSLSAVLMVVGAVLLVMA